MLVSGRLISVLGSLGIIRYTPRKMNERPLKKDHVKRKLIFQPSIPGNMLVLGSVFTYYFTTQV